MSSTSTFCGDSVSKPSSRVLRPPGGGSSISFGGGDPEPPSAPRSRNVAAVCEPTKTNESVVKPAPQPAPEPTQQNSQPAVESTGASGCCPQRRTCGYNPITGEAYAAENTTAAKPHTSTVVRQPPGGASTRPW